MKSRTFQSVLLAASGLMLVVCPLARAADTLVGGTVRDAQGVPQIGALVQLLRADASVIQAVRTDAHGRFRITGVLPGVYQLKAMETSFLPTLRENLRVSAHGRTEANLTLSTLLDALNWLPAQKRNAAEPEDDWTWTLRSAAYRPLLRYVGEDGVETLETPETSAHAAHGRLLIQSGAAAFAEGGPSETIEYRRDTRGGAGTLLRARVSDAPGAPAELLAGYSKENSAGAGFTSVLAYRMDRAVTGTAGSGLRVLNLRSGDTLRLTPELTAEVGSQMQSVALGAQATSRVSPFANVSWTRGGTTVEYSLTTAPGLQDVAGFADGRSLLPAAVMRGSVLGVEHGLHQELMLEHTDNNGMATASVAIYRDEVRDPIVNAVGLASGLPAGSYLFDPQTRTTRLAGNDYTARGVAVKASHKGPAGTRASVSYTSGSALAPTQSAPASPAFRAQSAQAVDAALEGSSTRTGTQWRTSYRWQSAGTANAVDLFGPGMSSGMADAYLGLFLKQSLHLSHIVPGGVDAVVDVRNLLAEGYHPFLTADGTTLFFAQADRSIQGGLAFYF